MKVFIVIGRKLWTLQLQVKESRHGVSAPVRPPFKYYGEGFRKRQKAPRSWSMQWIVEGPVLAVGQSARRMILSIHPWSIARWWSWRKCGTMKSSPGTAGRRDPVVDGTSSQTHFACRLCWSSRVSSHGWWLQITVWGWKGRPNTILKLL